ncbi:MAG: DUF2169 domain-containing protein [Pseudomonadota bacterium]
MLQLNNNTPFATKMALFPDEQGVDTLYLLVRASFNIGKNWTLCEQQIPPVDADEYLGERDDSSLKYASDMHIGKAATDIIMLGKACAKDRQAVQYLDASVSVGSVAKTIRVFGNRQWNNGQITQAEPFETMSMIYEKAYGGTDNSNPEQPETHEKNPLGQGYNKHQSMQQMNGQFLPNLEDPNNLIQQYQDQPEPACFTSSSASWKPRIQFAGTYDEQWENHRAPYLPLNFNKRFCNTAHEDLIYPGYLQGGEEIEIVNMHPAGSIQCQLPTIKLTSEIQIKNKQFQPEFNLETLLLEPNLLQLSMTWRASFQCDKKALKIDNININMMR